jgi:hypothetical protein
MANPFPRRRPEGTSQGIARLAGRVLARVVDLFLAPFCGEQAINHAVQLREVVAGLLLFGMLVGRADIESAGGAALNELVERGYAAIGAENPVRVYPLALGVHAEAHQAAAWRPGVISLRPDPAGSRTASVYLRHELMHEASFRTCAGKLPLWAEEAAAIAFAGEAADSGDVNPRALDHLHEAARLDVPLDTAAYQALARLVAQHGWPREPCAQSDVIAALLAPARAAGTPLAYVVASMISGRVLESAGDTISRWPPGSLLKIPFAAALDAGDDRRLGEALARSDPVALLDQRGTFRHDRFDFLLSPLRRPPLPEPIDESDWHALLGERDRGGAFPTEASLEELALVVRAALLTQPARFTELRRNGELPGSTLLQADPAVRTEIARLRAVAKTGTVSNARGEPVVGHLAIAWPAEQPAYVAVLRKGGLRGAAVANAARSLIRHWREEYPPDRGEVHVRMFSLLRTEDVELVEPCPGVEVRRDGANLRTTTCGELRLRTAAPGARADRVVRGLLEKGAERWLLITDFESYADAVLDAEAADLQGEARAALRAVIAWNGMHGSARHPDDRALCDTTHCMVFLGLPPQSAAAVGPRTGSAALMQLDALSRKRSITWFPFSRGGSEPWSRSIDDSALADALHEEFVVDVTRERTRNGEVVFHLTYPGNAEVVPCDVLRKALGLPSCPSRVSHEAGAWRFDGTGSGHGLGLDIERARELAVAGHGATEILRDAYGE